MEYYITQYQSKPMESLTPLFKAALRRAQQRGLRTAIRNGWREISVGENTPGCMRHGCSAHGLRSALNGTLGLTASRAGAIDFDALWVTPWQACSDVYPTSARVVKSALNGTLGLSACRAAVIVVDALWVTVAGVLRRLP